jgi:5-hydroxyisourate hydrolase-like protein (transthyretin family)
MRALSLISGCLLCLFVCSGCEISGSVTDTGTGAGIEGVRVSILSSSESNPMETYQVYTTYTDLDGNYRMSSFLGQSKERTGLTIHFSKPGYAFEPETAKITLNDEGQGSANSEGMAIQ